MLLRKIFFVLVVLSILLAGGWIGSELTGLAQIAYVGGLVLGIVLTSVFGIGLYAVYLVPEPTAPEKTIEVRLVPEKNMARDKSPSPNTDLIRDRQRLRQPNR